MILGKLQRAKTDK